MLNNFIFNGINYLQKLGELYALEIMQIFSRENLKETSHIHYVHFSNFYCQFINDIFLLWNGSKTQLVDFITRLNSRHPTIKFNFKYSVSGIKFFRYKNLQK